MGQKVTATMEPHMAQRYRCELPNFEMRHAHHLALPLAFLQEYCSSVGLAQHRSSPIEKYQSRSNWRGRTGVAGGLIRS
jgi:hypothetical protein